MRWIVGVIILIVLMPLASSHIQPYSDVRTLRAGDYDVLLNPRPSPMYAEETLLFSVIASQRTSAGYATGFLEVSIILRNSSDELSVPLRLASDDQYRGSTMLSAPGTYEATVRLVDENGTHEGTTSLRIYPALGFRLTPVGEERIMTEQQVELEIETRVNGSKASIATDLLMRIEHWSDDHLTLLGTEDVAMHEIEPGRWRADHSFPKKGMYHLFFSSESGGFTFDDVPMMHLTVSDDIQLPLKTVGYGHLVLLMTALGGALFWRRG